MATKIKKQVPVKPGQIWKDNDPRVQRMLKVIVINDTNVVGMNTTTGRLTRIKRERFLNHHNNGYSYVKAGKVTKTETKRASLIAM